MRLNDFIEGSLDRFNRSGVSSRLYVKEPGWDTLYVRLTKRYVDGTTYKPVLDLSSLEVEEDLRGTGLFTKLVEEVRKTWPDLHIYVESVINDRFGRYLEKRGFLLVGFSNYFLKSLNFQG